MSKTKNGRRIKKSVLILLSGVAAAGGAYLFWQNGLLPEAANGWTDVVSEQTEAEEQQTADDRPGAEDMQAADGKLIGGEDRVAEEIRESGTITYGTIEQDFEVAEVTEVSSASSSSSSEEASRSASASAQNGGDTGNMGTVSANTANDGALNMAASAGAANMTANAGAANMTANAGASGSAASASADGEAVLVVEEVYVASGQKIQKGDRILKITDESIADYRKALEAAVSAAQLQVKQEEINLETKQAEADYTYEMYLAKGETAEETYEATITSLEEKIADLEEEIEEEDDEEALEELEAELKIAQNNLVTGSLEAKQDYEKAMTNYRYADQLYEIDTNGLGDDLEEAQSTLEECQGNLEAFEEQIGDGIVYAEYSGIVSEAAYAAGDSIQNEATILTCTDEENVTMTVAVSQEDIARISVGEAAVVYLTAYEGETFEAKVSAISTTAAAGSKTVNYEVTVTLTGDISKVYDGMTGEAGIVNAAEGWVKS